jgi:hypothetical protein
LLNSAFEYRRVAPLHVQHPPVRSDRLRRVHAAEQEPVLVVPPSLRPYVGSIETVDPVLENARYGFSG